MECKYCLPGDNNNGFLTRFKHVRHALYLAVALEPRLGPNLALLHQLEVWLAQKNLPRSKVLHVMLQRAGKSGVNGHHVLEGELIPNRKNQEQRPFKNSLKNVAVEQLVSNQGPGTALLLLMVDLPAQLNLLKLRTSTVKPTHAVQQVSK